MPDLQTRLIDAAVRPFTDDAEMKLAAAHLLGEMVQTDGVGAKQAIERWETVDAKGQRPVWRIALFSGLLVVSTTILPIGTYKVINFRQAFNRVSGSTSPASPAKKPGKATLNEDEQLILYGDETQKSKSGKAKGLWDRHPENPAYFAEYVEAYLSENGKLPEDFLAEALRIDPQNAWFLYLAAGVEAKDCIKRGSRSAEAKAAREMPELEIMDPDRFGRALQLIREARDLSFCNDYKADLMRQKIPLLAQENQIERLISTGHLAGMTASDTISIRRLGEAIAAKAILLGREKNASEFQELVADSEAFARKTLSTEPCSLVAGLVAWVNISSIFQGLAAGAKELGLHPQTERSKAIHDELHSVRESLKKRELLVNGVKFTKKSGFLPGVMTPMVSRQAANPPAIADAEIKPGRLMDHEMASMIGAVVAFLLLGFCLSLAWAFRFRQGAPIHRLARRMEYLLLPADWLWIVGLGIVLPFLFVASVNRFTPLGGRDFSVTGMKFLLPTAHFFGLVLLLLIVPILISRWRLGKRAAVFGFTWKNSWIGWIAVISVALYVFAVGWVAPSASTDLVVIATSLLILPKIWLPTVAGQAIMAKPTRLLMSGTIARVLVPVYASAMLLMISLVPVFKAAEQYWFERDTFMKLDPAFPGMGTYEYKVAVQLQKELREILGYTP